jgi:hypothetical protein
MNAPVSLIPSFECVPRDLKAIPRWIDWKFVKREDGSLGKVPQGRTGNVNAHDPKNWMSFEDAVTLLRKQSAGGAWPLGGGIGFVFTDDDDIGGVDLDGCRDPETGKIAAWANRVLRLFDGAYIEVSPSGTGFHIITRGAPKVLARTQRAVPAELLEGDVTVDGKEAMVEAYVSKRYFTITGDHATGRMELAVRREAWEQVAAFLRGDQSRQDREDAARKAGKPAEPLSDEDIELVRSALATFTSDDVDRNTWVGIGMALKGEFGEDGKAIWTEWMARSANDNATETEKIWKGLPIPDSIGIGSIFWYAGQHGWKLPRKKGGGGGADASAAVLAAIIDGVELWHDERRRPYATVVIARDDGPTHRENLAVSDGGTFADWLTREFYRATGAPPKREKLREAVSLAQARAVFDGEQHTTWIRTAAGADGKLYLDIGDADWRAIEIDKEGWRIISDPPVKFRRSGGGQALPLPVKGNAETAIAQLGELIRPQQPEHLKLIIGFMVASLRAGYPIPILVLDCEPGSAKTSTLRVVVSFIDPHVLSTPGLAASERDLVVAAHNRWLLPADNVAEIDRAMSDILCRLVTGGGTVGRALYTDEGENSTPVMRPMVMTVLNSPTMQGDFIDRSITVPLARIERGGYLPERVVRERLTGLQPVIMGALLDGASVALRRLDKMEALHAGKLPRMADFTLWAEAAGEAFGWKDGEFLEAYQAMLDERAGENAADDPLFGLIRDWLRATPLGDAEGTAGELLDQFRNYAEFEVADRAASWARWFPKSARAFSGQLKTGRRALAALGVVYTNRPHPHSRTQGKIHCLELTGAGLKIPAGDRGSEG